MKKINKMLLTLSVGLIRLAGTQTFNQNTYNFRIADKKYYRRCLDLDRCRLLFFVFFL